MPTRSRGWSGGTDDLPGETLSPVSDQRIPISETNLPRKIAESTGRLPPTPTDHTDTREISVKEFCDAPATIANTPMIRNVKLNEMLNGSQN